MWRDQAACVGTPTGIWFAAERGPDTYRPAKEICAGCPVLEECAHDALWGESPPPYGCWGGMSPRQRRLIRTGEDALDEISATVTAPTKEDTDG